MCCCSCLSDVILIIISVLFPPLPVWIRTGICSCDSLINILLCFLGYFPGLIHSWYIIAKYPPYHKETQTYYIYLSQRPDLENQVHHHHHHHTCSPVQSPPPTEALITHQPEVQPQITYGAINDNPSSSSQPDVPPPTYTELDTGKN